ncbi:MAG: hypothetical protein WC350_05875 [Candidatus Micrarchaeia archaeon]|jgi:hypothetical protein
MIVDQRSWSQKLFNFRDYDLVDWGLLGMVALGMAKFAGVL